MSLKAASLLGLTVIVSFNVSFEKWYFFVNIIIINVLYDELWSVLGFVFFATFCAVSGAKFLSVLHLSLLTVVKCSEIDLWR